MRHLVQLMLAPSSRFVRLVISEKRLPCEWIAPEDASQHLPIFIDEDGRRREGLWAILDHLEGAYPERPLAPEDAETRAESLRLLDWAMGPLQENVTKRIVYERAAQRFTGSQAHRAPDMEIVRAGREALRVALADIGTAAEQNGYLASRECSMGDFAIAAHLSAIDYFGEVPWTEFPAAAEWYMRLKSRPSFRTLLGDRVPGQPPAPHYPDLDA